jgi:hypothetical protein
MSSGLTAVPTPGFFQSSPSVSDALSFANTFLRVFSSIRKSRRQELSIGASEKGDGKLELYRFFPLGR